jgi:putative FmdB family regulatory protein
MAYYEFVCRECGHGFTEKRSFAQASHPAACPACASEHTQKRLSAVAVIGGSSRSPGRAAGRETIPLSVGNGGSCGCGGGGCGCHN